MLLTLKFRVIAVIPRLKKVLATGLPRITVLMLLTFKSRVIVAIPKLKKGFSLRITQDYSPNAFDVVIQSNRSNPEAEKRF